MNLYTTTHFETTHLKANATKVTLVFIPKPLQPNSTNLEIDTNQILDTNNRTQNNLVHPKAHK